MRLTRLVLVIAFLAGAAGPAGAQVVNVQSSLATPAKPGFSGSLTGSAQNRTGNVSLLIFRGAGVARYRQGDHLFVAILSGNYGTNSSGRFLNNTFEHLRYRFDAHRYLLGEVFAQHTFNQFWRLTARALFGAGPLIRIVEKKEYSLKVGVAYMLELERLADDGEIDGGAEHTAHRNSSYITGHYALDKRIQAVNTFYVQPRLDDFGDVRLLNDLSLVVKAKSWLSLTNAFTIAYDRRPPATVKRLDTTFTSSFTVEF